MTIKKVILRKAFPGIISAMGLGVSRAFGETMAVLTQVEHFFTFKKKVSKKIISQHTHNQ
jgi:ABC-type phosphate transport system permease subunit